MTKIKQTIAVILSLVLMASAILGQLPVGTKASTAGYGISNPRTDSSGVTTWDCIWFGNYWQSNETVKEPIKWRVLSVNGDDAFLLADKNLDFQFYHTEYGVEDVTWETCSLRKWLNNIFYWNAFNAEEQTSIRTTTVVNRDNPYCGTKGGNNTQDNVYLLSIGEATNTTYGFSSDFEENEARVAFNTSYAAYAEAKFFENEYGDEGSFRGYNMGEGCWWLRSPGRYSTEAAFVDYWGNLVNCDDSICSVIGDDFNAIRPALHINLSSSAWSKAGTVDSSGGSTGGAAVSPVPSSPTPSPDTGNNETEKTTIEDGASLEIGGAKGGNADGEVLKFFPGDWNLSLSTFPVKLSRTSKKDGSYNLKIAVGVGKSDMLKSDSSWSKYKKNVENADKYTKRAGFLANYRDKYGLKTASAFSTSAFKKKPELAMMGYLEQIYDRNGKLVATAGKMAAEAKWNASASWMFATPVGPFYLSLSGGGKITGNLGPKYDHKKKEWKMDGSLTLTPNVTIEGGYGIDKVATIGAQGKASVPIQAVPFSKASLEASAGVRAYVVFILDKTWTLASYKKTLWDTISKKSFPPSPYTYFRSQEKETVRLLDTSFAGKTTPWNSGGAKKASGIRKASASRTTGVTAGNTIRQVLQEGILPSSLPIMREIGGKKVMVFQALDPGRRTENGSVLKYSVCRDGVWSEPKAILDDGRADQFADMKVVNGKLVVTWQKQKEEQQLEKEDSEVEITALLEEMGKNSEIYYSEFDPATDSFINTKAVTDNDSADMMPQICDNTDDVVIAWLRNDKNDLMQTTENACNTIITRKLENGVFQDECALCQTEKAVSSYAVYGEGGEIQAAYTGDSSAVYDRTGKKISSGEETAVTSLRYTGGNLSYIAGGSLYQYNPSDGKTQTFQPGTAAFGSSVQYCGSGDRQAVLWSEYDEDGDTGKVKVSIRTENGYSDPVTLYEGGAEMIRHLSPVLTEDGIWQILANSEDMGTGLNSLAYMEKEPSARLGLSGAEIDENDVNADGLTAVDYFVTNIEDTVVDTIVVSVRLEDGTVIKKEIKTVVQPGENVAGTVYLDLSAVDKKETVQVSVYARGQEDINQNTITCTVGMPEVQVRGTAKESSFQVTVQAELKNNSKRAAEVTADLSQNGKAVKSSSAIPLKAGETKTTVLAVPKSAICYSGGAAYLKLEAQVKEGDYYSDNNVDYVILYQNTAAGSTGGEKKTGTVKVNPKKKTVTAPGRVINLKIKNKKKKLAVLTWKKVSGAKGYQIQYATNKKYKKKKSKYAKKKKYTVKKLKKKKTYYFRVRAYKLNGKKKVYGRWSKSKKIKIKK